MIPIKTFKPKMTAVLIAGLLVCGIFNCSSTAEKHLSPDFGKNLSEAFAAQAVNPKAPDDPRPSDTLPGDISDQMYQKRYIKSMTEEKEDDNSNQGRNSNSFQ